MCRLFALSAFPQRVHAKFWLLDASDSFIDQSHRNPDGTGLGYFDERGSPVLDKQPTPAFADRTFVREAREATSTTFVSHIRFATTGAKTRENCHPFAMDGRLFAHNGVLGGLDRLEARLSDARSLVQGQTDSERYCALVTEEIRAHGGDVSAGIAAAVSWVAANLPLFSINFVLATPDELWALRYPETHRLYVIARPAGGRAGDRELHHESTHLRVHSPHLQRHPAVVVASERMDDSSDWRLLRSGELIRVTPELTIQSQQLLDRPPAHRIELHQPAQEQARQP